MVDRLPQGLHQFKPLGTVLCCCRSHIHEMGLGAALILYCFVVQGYAACAGDSGELPALGCVTRTLDIASTFTALDVRPTTPWCALRKAGLGLVWRTEHDYAAAGTRLRVTGPDTLKYGRCRFWRSITN